MKIEWVDLGRFGRLTDRKIQFSPGLNIICGPNEAGKSTLLEAIIALLFGFSEDGNSRIRNRLKERFSPWQGGPYRGALHVCLSNGEQYQIVRHFAEERTTIYRYPGATDVTRNYAPGHHGWVNFADQHLGLSRSAFRASAWINQGDLHLGKDHVDALKSKLEQLTGSVGTETSAQEALQRLGEWLRAKVNPGGHSAQTSPFVKAREDVARLTAELMETRRVLATLETEAVDERRLVDQIATLDHALAALESTLAWRELQELEDKLRRLEEIDATIAARNAQIAELADVANLTQETLDQTARDLDEVERLKQDLAAAEERLEAERDDNELACREVVRIDCQLASFSPAIEAPSDRVSSVEQAVAGWHDAEREAHEALDAVAKLRERLNAQLDDDPMLRGVPRTATAEAIDAALRRIEAAAVRVQEAESEADKAVIPRDLEAEYDALDHTLGDLTIDGLEQLQQWEHQIQIGETARRSKSRLTVPLAGLVAALLGLALGWTILKTPVALVAVALLGAIGYAVASIAYATHDRSIEEQIVRNRKLLTEELAQRGATSLAELRRRWNRRQEIQSVVLRAREARERLDARREERERALDELEHVAGTRNIAHACAARHTLQRHAHDAESQNASLRDAEERLETAQAMLVDSKQTARAALGSLGLMAEDPSQATAALESLRDNQLRRANLLRRKAEVEATIRTYLEHERTRGQLADNLAHAKEVAERKLAAIGVNAPPDDWGVAFRWRRERFIACQDALAQRRTQCTARHHLIGSDDPAEWRRRCAALRERSELADPADGRTRDEIEAQRAALSAQRQEGQAQLVALRARRDTAIARIREPAQIEEELATAEKTYARLLRLKEAIEGARDLLTKVAEDYRRDFAPQLADGLARSLAHVTDGRYQDLEIDPATLTVQIRSPERGDLIKIENLSQGTRDAVALLLRTSLAALLSSPQETVPFFLDDPLVHIDAERTRRLLEILCRLGDERQIFYFTQSPLVMEWARNRSDVQIHELAV